MRRVLLIRHGESIWNHSSKFTGWTDIPLTLKGKKDALRVTDTLNKNNLIPNIFFSSVLKRSIDTAGVIRNSLESSSPIYTSWRLNEKHYGTLEGIPREYIRTEYGEKYTKLLRSNFYLKPPIIPVDNRKKTTYPIFKNCYFKTIEDGESKENVLNRALPYFENDILSTSADGFLPLVVTHKHCLRVLMKHYLQLTDEEFENYSIPDNKITVLEFDAEMYFLKHFHL